MTTPPRADHENMPRLWTGELVLDDILAIAGVRRTDQGWAREYLTREPSPRRRRRKRDATMSGKIIFETPEETAAYEQARQATARNGQSPEQVELGARRAERTRQADARRRAWLEHSGFAAVIHRAEALLADLDRAHEEHQRAQAACAPLVTFIELAREAPEDHMLQRLARRAADLRQTISRPPLLFENAGALGELIDRVKTADLEGANGVRNPNVIEAWRRRFVELVTPLPGPGHAARCAQQVTVFLAEARVARGGRA